MTNTRGFTLIELLAVIVILSIILVIAVPQVMKVIDNAKKDSLASSVKLYASALETDYLASQTTGNIAAGATCVAGIVDFTNGTCTYALTVDTNGVPTATVTIVGSGKFAGYTGVGTKTDVTVTATP